MIIITAVMPIYTLRRIFGGTLRPTVSPREVATSAAEYRRSRARRRPLARLFFVVIIILLYFKGNTKDEIIIPYYTHRAVYWTQ